MADTDWDLISPYAGLLCLATVSIYCGAFGSLPPSLRAHTTPKQNLLQDDEDEGEEEDIPDRMSSGDAWLFPIVGSVALFGLYTVITYLGEEWINWLLGWYFSIAGVGSVWKSTVSLAKFVIGRETWRSFDRHRILVLRGPLEMVSLSFRTPTLVLLPVGMVPSILYSISAGTRKPAYLTDILALSFSHTVLSILKLDSFQTGYILLSGLFIYDIYWVFGTEVMVKVARSLDVPIKLVWPKSMTCGSEKGFAMLGLGDVVIPGLFIALALRYDHARAPAMETSFSKPYFLVTLTAYVVGLMTTMTVMHLWDRAQPALLYLSPACLLSLMATAVVRGEVGDVWRWSDDAGVSRGTRAMAEDEKGNDAPQPSSADDGDHVNGVTEGDGEEGAGEQEEVRRRKRGRKQVSTRRTSRVQAVS